MDLFLFSRTKNENCFHDVFVPPPRKKWKSPVPVPDLLQASCIRALNLDPDLKIEVDSGLFGCEIMLYNAQDFFQVDIQDIIIP